MCFLSKPIFWTRHGYWPHFSTSRTFNEKVWARMLFDRNPRWTLFSDKLQARAHVARTAGSEYLVPLLWTGDKPEAIPFDDLPSKFVIKTNHGCGCNIIVTDKTHLNRQKVRRHLGRWLRVNYCQDQYLGTEWGYKHIKPTIMIETFLNSTRTVPEDYKFFCYSGRAEFCKVDFDRFGNHSELFLDRCCNRLPIQGRGILRHQGKYSPPNTFEAMLDVAESIAQDIDFLRVDLYSVGGRIYFGELTCYHGGGMIRLCPRLYDVLLGEKWNINCHLAH